MLDRPPSKARAWKIFAPGAMPCMARPGDQAGDGGAVVALGDRYVGHGVECSPPPAPFKAGCVSSTAVSITATLHVGAAGAVEREGDALEGVVDDAGRLLQRRRGSARAHGCGRRRRAAPARGRRAGRRECRSAPAWRRAAGLALRAHLEAEWRRSAATVPARLDGHQHLVGHEGADDGARRNGRRRVGPAKRGSRPVRAGAKPARRRVARIGECRRHGCSPGCPAPGWGTGRRRGPAGCRRRGWRRHPAFAWLPSCVKSAPPQSSGSRQIEFFASPGSGSSWSAQSGHAGERARRRKNQQMTAALFAIFRFPSFVALRERLGGNKAERRLIVFRDGLHRNGDTRNRRRRSARR